MKKIVVQHLKWISKDEKFSIGSRMSKATQWNLEHILERQAIKYVLSLEYKCED